MLAVAMGLVVVASPWVEGQDAPKSKDPAPKVRGTLPQNWGKLGLSDEQKQKIYSAQSKFREKLDVLTKQIAELKDQERKEMEAVLTDQQKARLREIAGSKVPATETKTETKPAEKP
jgi:hypothetical protein